MFVSPRAARVLLEHLDSVGVLPVPVPVKLTPAQELVERYGIFLIHQRALDAQTVKNYQLVARRFLAAAPGAGEIELGGLDALAVTEFMTSACAARSVSRAKTIATALRSWLRFLFLEELIAVPLVQAVPSPAGWAAASLPKALSAVELAALLATCDRETGPGRRDYAVMVLAARLGLRGGEIAGLDLDDIDWVTGEVSVRGKGRRRDRLPLPIDVGRAVASYVEHGRPLRRGGAVFRRVGAPHGALTSSAVTGIVYRACDRAGVVRVGAHRLRHTAATEMLRSGASLSEIAQVLRHRSPNTTAIYAKVDRCALRELALPWPGSAS